MSYELEKSNINHRDLFDRSGSQRCDHHVPNLQGLFNQADIPMDKNLT